MFMEFFIGINYWNIIVDICLISIVFPILNTISTSTIIESLI